MIRAIDCSERRIIMFWKKRKAEATEKHDYDLTYDNLAIPEVHTHDETTETETSDTEEPPTVTYDSVAIPEVHIRKK